MKCVHEFHIWIETVSTVCCLVAISCKEEVRNGKKGTIIYTRVKALSGLRDEETTDERIICAIFL